MPERFTGDVPQLSGPDSGPNKFVFTAQLRKELMEFLGKTKRSIAGSQGQPSDPTPIGADNVTSKGVLQPASQSDHVHSVVTAAPSRVQLSGAPAIGTGDALVRAGATFVLDNSGATAGQIIASDGTGFAAKDDLFTKEYVFLAPGGAVDVRLWRAPFACESIEVKAYQTGGTSATVNARRNGALDHLAAPLATLPAAWSQSSTITNGVYAIGDDLEMRALTVVGVVTQIVIEVVFKKL